MSENLRCVVSFETVRFSDFDFADDAVIMMETTEVLFEAKHKTETVTMTFPDEDQGSGVR